MHKPLTQTAPILAAFLLSACGGETEIAAPPPKPIAWAEVEPAGDRTQRSLPGVVRAIDRVDLSFEVGGRVDTVEVETGERFKQGQTLARLDAKSYRLTVRARESELRQAEANLAEAANDFKRQKQLFDDGLVARAGYDLALSQRDAARSQVEIAHARLAIAEEDLGDTTLSAPYDGSVNARLAEPSQQVAAGETVLEIQSDDGGLEVEVALPETLIDWLRPGTRHPVSFPTRSDVELIGVVREIGARATDGNAFPVTLRLVDPPTDLRTGITAEVTFDLAVADSESERVAIPDTAFVPGPEQTTIAFVFDEQSGTLVARSIVIEDVSDGRAVVVEGLSAGERVAAKGLPFLRDGQQVELLGTGIDRYNQ